MGVSLRRRGCSRGSTQPRPRRDSPLGSLVRTVSPAANEPRYGAMADASAFGVASLLLCEKGAVRRDRRFSSQAATRSRPTTATARAGQAGATSLFLAKTRDPTGLGGRSCFRPSGGIRGLLSHAQRYRMRPKVSIASGCAPGVGSAGRGSSHASQSQRSRSVMWVMVIHALTRRGPWPAMLIRGSSPRRPLPASAASPGYRFSALPQRIARLRGSASISDRCRRRRGRSGRDGRRRRRRRA